MSRQIVEYYPQGNAENHRVSLLVLPSEVSDQDAIAFGKLPHLRNARVFRLSSTDGSLKEILDLVMRKTLIATLYLCTSCRYVWPNEWIKCESTGTDEKAASEVEGNVCLRRLNICAFDPKARQWTTPRAGRARALLDFGPTTVEFQRFGQLSFRGISFEGQGLEFVNVPSVSLIDCRGYRTLLTFDHCSPVRLTRCTLESSTIKSETSDMHIERCELSSIDFMVLRGNRFHLCRNTARNCFWNFYLTGGPADPQAVMFVGNRIDVELIRSRSLILVDNCAVTLLDNCIRQDLLQPGTEAEAVPFVPCMRGQPMVRDSETGETSVLSGWFRPGNPDFAKLDRVYDQPCLIYLSRHGRAYLQRNEMELVTFPSIVATDGCRVRFQGDNVVRFHPVIECQFTNLFAEFCRTMETGFEAKDRAEKKEDKEEKLIDGSSFDSEQAALRESLISSKCTEFSLNELAARPGLFSFKDVLMGMSEIGRHDRLMSDLANEKLVRDLIALTFQAPFIVNTDKPFLRCSSEPTDRFPAQLCFFPPGLSFCLAPSLSKPSE